MEVTEQVRANVERFAKAEKAAAAARAALSHPTLPPSFPQEGKAGKTTRSRASSKQPSLASIDEENLELPEEFKTTPPSFPCNCPLCGVPCQSAGWKRHGKTHAKRAAAARVAAEGPVPGVDDEVAPTTIQPGHIADPLKFMELRGVDLAEAHQPGSFSAV